MQTVFSYTKYFFLWDKNLVADATETGKVEMTMKNEQTVMEMEERETNAEI